jgi:flavin reductase (DIM6/NTAB) family NADH-FMN oxidoreductase RutF
MEKVKLGPRELLYPAPAVLVGATVGEKPNFMTVAWCGIAASEPPALSVSIRGERHTLKGIEQHGVFSVNVAPAGLVKEVDYCGIYSGKKRDKSGIFDVFYGVLKTAPLIRECPVNVECKTIHTQDLGSHILVVGQVMETYVSDDCMTDGKPDAEKIDPVIYTTGTGEYRRLGDVIAQSFNVGKNLKE